MGLRRGNRHSVRSAPTTANRRSPSARSGQSPRTASQQPAAGPEPRERRLRAVAGGAGSPERATEPRDGCGRHPAAMSERPARPSEGARAGSERSAHPSRRPSSGSTPPPSRQQSARRPVSFSGTPPTTRPARSSPRAELETIADVCVASRPPRGHRRGLRAHRLRGRARPPGDAARACASERSPSRPRARPSASPAGRSAGRCAAPPLTAAVRAAHQFVTYAVATPCSTPWPPPSARPPTTTRAPRGTTAPAATTCAPASPTSASGSSRPRAPTSPTPTSAPSASTTTWSSAGPSPSVSAWPPIPLSAFLLEGGPRHLVRFAFGKDVSTLDEASGACGAEGRGSPWLDRPRGRLDRFTSRVGRAGAQRRESPS